MEPGSPHDEALPDQDRPPMRRGTRVALAVAALVVAGGLVTVAAVKGTDDHPDAAPSSRVAPSSTSPVPAPVTIVELDPTGGVVVPQAQECVEATGNTFDCTVSKRIPSFVTKALRDVFPGATVSVVATTINEHRAGISERRVIARAGDRTVHIQVEQNGVALAGSGHRSGNGVDAARVTSRISGYVVDVTVTRPAAHPAALATVRRLSLDPRLLRVD